MAQGNRTRISMRFNDGTAFDEWLSLELRDTWTDPLGSLKFEAAPGRERVGLYQQKLQKGELVTVLVNDVSQGGYLIQTVRTTVSARLGVMFSVECQTPLITPYQASIDPKVSFKSQTDAPITTILDKAFAPFGFKDLIGDPTANVSAITGRALKGGQAAFNVDVLKQDQAAAQEGETAYQFAARLITRLGLALHCSFDGVLLLNAPDYEQAPSYDLVQSDDPKVSGDRFIDDIEIVDTNDNQFSECRVRGNPNDRSGQTQTALPDVTVKAADVLPARSAYASSTAAPYKPLIIKDKNARDRDRCISVAKLALGIRAKDAFVLSGEVDGFVSTSGAVWTTGTLANVRVDALGFREPMFILGRDLTRSRDRGDITRLRLIPKGALVLGDVPGNG